jgi:hypothetical protein
MHSLTSALDTGEWSTSRPSRFTTTERAPGTHLIGGWVETVINTLYNLTKSWDSSVGIAIDYGLDDRMIEVRIQVRAGNFFFVTVFRPALGPTQPPIQ